MRRGFTLIELLVIIGIMGLMVTVGIVSVRSGQGAARVKGATRDIFGAIRHARSIALVTQQPAVITYSNEEDDGEVIAKISIDSAKLFAEEVDRSKLETLTGQSTKWQQELVHIEKADSVMDKKTSKESEGEANEQGGETVEDVLFSPVDSSVVKGMRLKVEVGEEETVYGATPVRKPKISVFSNVDYLLGRYNEHKKKQEEEKKQEETDSKNDAVLEEMQKPVSVVWETNGRVESHRVWIYPDGKKPEQGLMIKIDSFGAAKVLNGDGSGEEK